MPFLNQLLFPFQHFEDAAAHLFTSLKVKFNRSHLQKEQLEHSNYPGLQYIVDVPRTSYSVSCCTIAIHVPWKKQW